MVIINKKRRNNKDNTYTKRWEWKVKKKEKRNKKNTYTTEKRWIKGDNKQKKKKATEEHIHNRENIITNKKEQLRKNLPIEAINSWPL